MKKAKIYLRNIIFFFFILGVSILPTLMFRTQEEASLLFKLPAYWIISVFIALVATRRMIQNYDDSR